MRLRKNVLAVLFAGLLAVGGVACQGGTTGGGTDGGNGGDTGTELDGGDTGTGTDGDTATS